MALLAQRLVSYPKATITYRTLRINIYSYQHGSHGPEVESEDFVIEEFDFYLLPIFLKAKERERKLTMRYPIKIPFQLRPLQRDGGTSKLPPVPW